MSSTLAVVVAYLSGLALASPVTQVSGSSSCTNFMLPVSVTAKNAVYDVVQVKNNNDATAFAVDIDTWSSPTPQERLLKNITVSGTYNINVNLCIPPDGKKKNSLQIATHGLAFDNRYWDVPVNPSEYSFVKAATDAGYSILTYDRLGTGRSDKPDAYSVVQAPLELEILRRITEMARSGELIEHARTNGQGVYPTMPDSPMFEHIIHVGHSFGSFLTSALIATYGNLSDAAVITGYIFNSHFSDLRWTSFGLEYAAENDKHLFGDRGSGYLVSGTASAVQTGFFSARGNTSSGVGGFEPELLDYAFSIRQTVVTSEVVSPSQLNLGVAAEYAGPVQFVIAEFDYLVCRGDCKNTFDATMIKSFYPKSRDVDFYIQEGTGHGLTMHRKANLGYKATFDWLDKNGL